MILSNCHLVCIANWILPQEELDDIIRHGSKELFADDNDEVGKSRQIHYDDAAIAGWSLMLSHLLFFLCGV